MEIKGLFLLIVFLLLGGLNQAKASEYSDSLVQGLNCNKINSQEIYKKIEKEALSPRYHLPVKNWGFDIGPYDLAACWSLSRAQRLFFYLARWGADPNMPASKRLYSVLEMIRGSSPFVTLPIDPAIRESSLKELKVFAQNENIPELESLFWRSLQDGFRQDFKNNRSLTRTFKSEIEYYQKRRFHAFLKNIRYIIGDGSRSPEKNRATRNRILRNLEENKLTLLLLRPKRVSQHVVLAKSFEVKSNGDIDIWVYDSNQPKKDQRITYSKSDQDFFAPEVVRGLPKVDDPSEALGVFIVDEDERTMIENTLVKYYSNKCS